MTAKPCQRHYEQDKMFSESLLGLLDMKYQNREFVPTRRSHTPRPPNQQIIPTSPEPACMDGTNPCSLCCQKCIRNGVGNEHDESNPFAVDNLLPAGTLVVDVQDGHLHCTHRHASDTWHPVPSHHLYAEDEVLCWISFLTKHHFLRATCCLGTSRRLLYIRIYLVPADCPDVQAILKHRSEAIMKEGYRHLQSLLPTIVQDQSSWDADELASITQPHKYF